MIMCVFVVAVVFCQVFDGAVIVLSLAPMVASTVANGPSSPWDAISLIITLRIWRVKRIIDGKLLYHITPFTCFSSQHFLTL